MSTAYHPPAEQSVPRTLYDIMNIFRESAFESILSWWPAVEHQEWVDTNGSGNDYPTNSGEEHKPRLKINLSCNAERFAPNYVGDNGKLWEFRVYIEMLDPVTYRKANEAEG
jgi:hypothetical protein